MQRRAKDYTDHSQWLWSDLPIEASKAAAKTLALRSAAGAVADWLDDGTAILPNAADGATIDRFRRDMLHLIGGSDSLAGGAGRESDVKMTFWDTDGHHHQAAAESLLAKREAKVLDLHIRLEAARQLIFAPKILDFLTDMFQDDVVAFQSLYFKYGSQQGAHQDTAFVITEPSSHFAASWIALEDVVPGAGELFYYPGSQRLDDLIFAGGTKALQGGDPDAERYSVLLEQDAEAAGHRRERLLIPRGTALIWAADLVHGGEPVRLSQTRRSLVTHYCPKRAKVPYAEHLGLAPRQVGDRAWVIGAN